MSQSKKFEESYLALMEFLILSKRNVIELGLEYKLTPMQAITLLFLNKPRAMSSFARLFSCDASNVTGIADGLERKNLIARTEDPTDRRTKILELLPEGVKMRSVLLEKLTDGSNYVFSKLSSGEAETFVGLLEKITAN